MLQCVSNNRMIHLKWAKNGRHTQSELYTFCENVNTLSTDASLAGSMNLASSYWTFNYNNFGSNFGKVMSVIVGKSTGGTYNFVLMCAITWGSA